MTAVEHKPSILFVCTGNLYRSPLAAAFFADLLERRGMSGWRVESAGTWTTAHQRLPQEVTGFGRLLGLDLTAHTTRVVSRELIREFDIVVVMERGHKEALDVEFPEVAERVFMLTELAHGKPFDIPDPALKPTQRDEILGDMVDVIRDAFPHIVEIPQSRGEGRA